MNNSATYTLPVYPLFFLFTILKLCHVIDWSWWWVTCPIWIGLAILLVFASIAGIIALMALIGFVMCAKGK